MKKFEKWFWGLADRGQSAVVIGSVVLVIGLIMAPITVFLIVPQQEYSQRVKDFCVSQGWEPVSFRGLSRFCERPDGVLVAPPAE